MAAAGLACDVEVGSLKCQAYSYRSWEPLKGLKQKKENDAFK